MPKSSKQPDNMQRALRGLVGLCAALGLADFIIHRHAYFDLEATPLFFAILGAVSMVMIAVLSLLMRRLITRPEGYYEGPTAANKSATNKSATSKTAGKKPRKKPQKKTQKKGGKNA